jgi:HEAT repeat protein
LVVTLEHVIAVLSPDEPNYKGAAQLSPDWLPHLEVLIKNDPSLAAKAAYLASLIQDERSVSIIDLAAKSSIREVRVTAAYAVKNLRFKAIDDILNILKDDPDEGVRIKAVKSIEARRRIK